MAIFGWVVVFIVGSLFLLWGIAAAFVTNAFSGNTPLEAWGAIVIAIVMYAICYLTCPFTVAIK